MPTLSTLGGWAAIIAIGALYYYFTTRRAADKGRRLAALKPASRSIETRKEPKARKPRKESGAHSSGDQDVRSSDHGQKKKRQPATRSDREEEIYASARVSKDIDRDDEVDNREFARQLSSAKAGTLLSAKAEAGTRQKSVKQSQAKEKPVTVETSSDNATAPSSATGGDADDDQSPLNSPELNATMMTSPVTNGGVSDMLEAPAPGPAVLRVTAPTTQPRPKKAKPQQTFEPVESKKQRQNRKKAEANKLTREEDERERKVLMEKQRRTAREAEGRAAKDGSTSLAAKSPSSSAWTSSPNALTGKNSVESKNVELLDTYEPSTGNAARGLPSEPLYSESELAGSDWQKLLPSLPSEEEQMRFAIEDSDNWKTVKSKEKRVQKKKGNQDKESSTDEPETYGVPPVVATSGPGKKWGMTLVHVEPNGEVVEVEKEVQDSEWEVA